MIKYLLLFVLFTSTLSAQEFYEYSGSIGLLMDKVSIYDSFYKTLTTFDKEGNKIKEYDLSNTDLPTTKTTFIQNTKDRIYALSKADKKLYIFDDKYNVEEKYTLKLSASIELSRKFFQPDYTGLIFADKSNGILYRLEGGRLTTLTELTGKEILDWYFYNKKIYVLLEDTIVILSDAGLYRRRIPLKVNFNSIFISKSGIFVKNSDRVERYSLEGEIIDNYILKNIDDFVVLNNKIFYVDLKGKTGIYIYE